MSTHAILRRRTLAVAVAGISVVALAAGCSSAGSSSAPADAAASAPADSAASAPAVDAAAGSGCAETGAGCDPTLGEANNLQIIASVINTTNP